MTVATYLSIADIAERLNVPRHRVAYLVVVFAIHPAVRVGSCAGYAEDAVEQVRRRLPVDRRLGSSHV